MFDFIIGLFLRVNGHVEATLAICSYECYALFFYQFSKGRQLPHLYRFFDDFDFAKLHNCQSVSVNFIFSMDLCVFRSHMQNA